MLLRDELLMRLRRPLLVLSVAGVTAVGLVPALASTPADSGVLTPSPGPGVVSASWSGTIAGANANSDCSVAVNGAVNDHHSFTLAVPSVSTARTT